MVAKWHWLLVACLVCNSEHSTAEQVDNLRVVTELSPPHQTLVGGQVGGYSTELVKAILQHAGLTASIEVYPWARAYRLAMQQPNTLIYNMARTAEREPLFHWIGPVAAYQLGFVKLSHRQDITLNSLADAKQYSIAVQRHDIAQHYLMDNGFGKPGLLVLAADIVDSWQLLLNGKVDLIIDDPKALAAMAKYLQVKPEYVSFEFAIVQLQQQTYLAASKATSVEKVQVLRQAHGVVSTTEQYQKVMRSEFSEGTTTIDSP